MNFVLTTIYDKKAQTYGPIQTKKNTAVAARDFQQECENNQSALNKFPEDYCLVILGEYDIEKGIIKPLDKIRILNEAEQYVIKEKQNEEIPFGKSN